MESKKIKKCELWGENCELKNENRTWQINEQREKSTNEELKIDKARKKKQKEI